MISRIFKNNNYINKKQQKEFVQSVEHFLSRKLDSGSSKIEALCQQCFNKPKYILKKAGLVMIDKLWVKINYVEHTDVLYIF